MIRHTVVLKLKNNTSAEEQRDFFIAAGQLAALPGVQKFECLKQISKKNKFEFGISMEFDNQDAYDQYSNHPEHLQFVQQYWLKQVVDFLEIDYEPLP